MGWTLPTNTGDFFRREMEDQLSSREKSTPPAYRVLELATLRWEADKPTHHKEWLESSNVDWIMSDVEAGLDVDVVADAHDLVPFEDASFDALIACSLLEHVKRPWIVLQAMSRVLKPGGLLLVTTHQSFPIHGYPDDYFRFSDKAMTILAQDAGLTVVQTKHEFPCKIIPQVEIPVWNEAAEAYLNVELFAKKPYGDA